jgi:hypothetical protein
MEIALTQGYKARVDASDYALVAQTRWQAVVAPDVRTVYARRMFNRKPQLLHRFLMQAPPGVLVDHRDGDGLNNTRRNLRLTDNRGNARNIVSSKNQKAGGYKGVRWHAAREAWEEARLALRQVCPVGKMLRYRDIWEQGTFREPQCSTYLNGVEKPRGARAGLFLEQCVAAGEARLRELEAGAP